ncbi:hypothetical protein HC766_03690 [Candidatus Gracilibacteria bacterium]|nr:hypothetical protein [Candidatus Gracilibacteria bacterium]NJS41444.1 hypothetical protein [Candidatus Gracilibacteria bacterium]
MIELWKNWQLNVSAFCIGYLSLSLCYELAYFGNISPKKRYFFTKVSDLELKKLIAKYEQVTTYFGVLGVGFFLVTLLWVKSWQWINYSIFWFFGVQLRNILARILLDSQKTKN